MTSFAYLLDEEILASLLVSLVSGIPSGIFSIVCYVLSSMALYTLAQRRQIRNAWLSWVPVLNCWILGSLSDQYRYVAKGQIKSKRKWMLGLHIANLVLGLLIGILIISIVASAIHSMDFTDSMAVSLLVTLALILPLLGISISITVIRFIALYDVYVSMDPNNAVLFLVLSVLIGVVEPFFLFFNRDKDTGMPPRRDSQPRPQPLPGAAPEDRDYL